MNWEADDVEVTALNAGNEGAGETILNTIPACLVHWDATMTHAHKAKDEVVTLKFRSKLGSKLMIAHLHDD